LLRHRCYGACLSFISAPGADLLECPRAGGVERRPRDTRNASPTRFTTLSSSLKPYQSPKEVRDIIPSRDRRPFADQVASHADESANGRHPTVHVPSASSARMRPPPSHGAEPTHSFTRFRASRTNPCISGDARRLRPLTQHTRASITPPFSPIRHAGPSDQRHSDAASPPRLCPWRPHRR